MLPLYYQFMPAVNMWELLSHRVLWSAVLLGVLFLLIGYRVPWARLRSEPRQLGLILLAGPVMSISWCMFTWCLTTGQVLATSLAFFMTPLFNIVFAVLFLRSSPRKTPGGGAGAGRTGLHALFLRPAALVSLIMGPTSPSTVCSRRRSTMTPASASISRRWCNCPSLC